MSTNLEALADRVLAFLTHIERKVGLIEEKMRDEPATRTVAKLKDVWSDTAGAINEDIPTDKYDWVQVSFFNLGPANNAAGSVSNTACPGAVLNAIPSVAAGIGQYIAIQEPPNSITVSVVAGAGSKVHIVVEGVSRTPRQRGHSMRPV